MTSTWTERALRRLDPEPATLGGGLAGRRNGLAAHCVARGGIVLFTCGLAAAVTLGSRGPTAGDRREAMAETLRRRGFVVDADDVIFVERPRGLIGSAFGSVRAVARVAASSSEPRDVWLFDAQVSPSGVLLDLSAGHNLSDTSGADETRPVAALGRVAYGSSSVVEGAPSVVTVLDFGGQRPVDWPLLERIQNGITNLQQTGSVDGVERRAYVVAGEGSSQLGLAVRGGRFVVSSGSRTAELPEGAAFAALPDWISADTQLQARPGNLVTWSVDRVRAEIGDDSMQAVKEVVFTALDIFERNREELTGDTGEASIAEDLGEAGLDAPRREIVADLEIGWPPPPLEPWVTPALPGEGQWNAKDDPAFFRNQPNLPPTFLTTFIRSDRTRKATRAYLVIWDPRQVELGMMAGTVEPKGATGKAGPGLIPRSPELMERVAAASNAGFQALHGEYGMMADGVVYLPPKPYAATVMRLRDGSTAFGTWPVDPTVPDAVVSYRQNMTVMVQDEKFNPYDRAWWGGTVPGAEDKTHTVRTGICLTREGFVAYFYGADLSPTALAQAMIQTRCSYGIALDMNAGHAGLEFYKVAPKSELPPLGRGLESSWEAEGDVPDLPGYAFRAKRLIKGMGLMSFPRYIKRESRDYFYLTLRYVLPGENLPIVVTTSPLDAEGTWRVKGLPQHGFPYAMATSRVRPDAADPDAVYRVLALDPRTIAAARPAAEQRAIVTVDPGDQKGELGLYFWGGAFHIAAEAPDPGALLLARGDAVVADGAAVVCVNEASSMLYYLELEGGEGGKRAKLGPVRDYLEKRVECTSSLSLTEPLALTLGDNTSLGGEAARPARRAAPARLVRAHAPGGRRIFETTPVVGRDVWYPLQQHRVRYFKKRDD